MTHLSPDQELQTHSHSPKETLPSPNFDNNEEDMGDDDHGRSIINKKRSLDPTPSSSCKSQWEAKGVGAKMAHQNDKLIEVVATRQLGGEDSTNNTCTVTYCIQLLNDMDQVVVGSDLYFYAINLFRKDYCDDPGAYLKSFGLIRNSM